MAKKIDNWRIFIKTTTDDKEEQRQVKAIHDYIKGGVHNPDFKMTLVGYSAEWGNVIETSTIVLMSSTKSGVHFKTYSGSVYTANPKDFLGIFRHTVHGDMRVE